MLGCALKQSHLTQWTTDWGGAALLLVSIAIETQVNCGDRYYVYDYGELNLLLFMFVQQVVVTTDMGTQTTVEVICGFISVYNRIMEGWLNFMKDMRRSKGWGMLKEGQKIEFYWNWKKWKATPIFTGRLHRKLTSRKVDFSWNLSEWREFACTKLLQLIH